MKPGASVRMPDSDKNMKLVREKNLKLCKGETTRVEMSKMTENIKAKCVKFDLIHAALAKFDICQSIVSDCVEALIDKSDTLMELRVREEEWPQVVFSSSCMPKSAEILLDL